MCNPPDLLTRLKQLIIERDGGGGFDAQQVGPELFLHQQLADHPMRTLDPDEAKLFVVPSILAYAAEAPLSGMTQRLCGISGYEVVRRLTAEIQASPFYRKSDGRDHLLVFSHWRVALHFYSDVHHASKKTARYVSVYDDLKRTVRNFVLGFRLRRSAIKWGHKADWSPTAKLIAIPHLAPSVLAMCHYSYGYEYDSTDSTRRVVCEAQSNRTRPTLADYRHGCYLEPMPGEGLNKLLDTCLFHLHVRGDDAGSSRVAEAINSGALQIFLSNKYYEDTAVFRCRVPWADMVYTVDDREFLAHPVATMERALSRLMS
eukprot:scaffold345651_cov43-Prasinocladus_malaysianus.AAC.1